MIAGLQGNGQEVGLVAGRLPPSERDLAVYRLVKVEQRSTRAAAKAVGVSQTRVCQIVERVAAFLVETTGGEDDELRERRLAVAERVAAERLGYFISEAVHSFRRSTGVQETIREVEWPEDAKPTMSVGVTKMNFGEPKYLLLAARLALMAAKLPAGGLGIECREEGGEVRDEGGFKEGKQEQKPLKEDCSAKRSEQASRSKDRPKESAVNSAGASNYGEQATSSSARVGETGTVQSEKLDDRERRARKEFLSAAG